MEQAELSTLADDAAPRPPWDRVPRSGEHLGPYILGTLLGQGYFGSVFRIQPNPGIPWYEAVKVLHRGSSRDKEAFLREIATLKELRLPAMARIHAAGESNGHFYYTMDLVEGLSIDRHVRQYGLATPAILRLVMELCDTIHLLHEQNVMHLDLKPSNVMIDTEGRLRLLDFGVSVRLNQPGLEGPSGCTPEFASVQQILGAAPGPAMDVYALGCMAYTLLSGTHPKLPSDPLRRATCGTFVADPALTREERHRRCMEGAFTPLHRQAPSLPAALCAIIDACLEPDPGRRPRSALELRRRLDAAGAELEVFLCLLEMPPDESLRSALRGVCTAAGTDFAAHLHLVCVEDAALLPDGRRESAMFIASHREDLPAHLHLPSQGGDSASTAALFDRELRDSLLEQVHETAEISEAWSHSPWKALDAYREEDHALFFGRETELAAFTSLLAQLPPHERLVCVLGSSGAGKSSFIRAGLFPRLKAAGLGGMSFSRCLRVRPGPDLEALVAQLPALLQEGGCLAVAVDQFEEALLIDGEAATARALLRLTLEPRILIILTVRGDFYQELSTFLARHSLPGRTWHLPPPSPDAIARMIRQPARLAHLSFETDVSGERLDEILRREAVQDPESLAALSFTLDEIFRASPRGRLSVKAWRELGGMHGALARRAESLVGSLMLRDAAAAFHHVFHQLIRIDDDHNARRLYAPYTALTSLPDAALLTDAFIAARLFRASAAPASHERIITVAHESLLRTAGPHAWRRLVRYLDQQRSNLLSRKRLALITRDWLDSGRDSAFLITDKGRLAELLRLASAGFLLEPAEHDFLRASRSRRRHRIFITLAAAAAAVTAAALLLDARSLTRTLREEQSQAQIRLEALGTQISSREANLQQLTEAAAQARSQVTRLSDYVQTGRIVATPPRDLSSPAVTLPQLAAIPPEHRGWPWGHALAMAAGDTLPLLTHAEECVAAAFSPDPAGRFLATASWDDSVALYNAFDGSLIQTLYPAPGTDLEEVIFSRDGSTLLCACDDGRLYAWDLAPLASGAALAPPQSWPLPHDRIRRLSFSPDGSILLAAGSEGSFSLWDFKRRDFSHPLASAVHAEGKRLYAAIMDAEGHVYSAGFDGSVRSWLWRPEAGELLPLPHTARHEAEIWSATISPDGTSLLTTSRDRSARLWSLPELKEERLLGLDDAPSQARADIMSGDFSPDGRSIVTASADRCLRFYDRLSGRFLYERRLHAHTIHRVCFSPDGRHLATASADRSAALLLSGADASFRPRQNALSIKLGSACLQSIPDPSAHLLLSGARDGVIYLHDLHSGALLQSFSHTLAAKASLTCVAWLGSSILSAGSDGSVLLWDRAGGQAKMLLAARNSPCYALACSPDAKLIACAHADNSVTVLDAASGALIRHLTLTPLPESALSCLVFIDEGTLAIGEADGSILSCSPFDSAPPSLLLRHSRKIFSLRRVPAQGDQAPALLSCSRDGSAALFHPHTRAVERFNIHAAADCLCVALDPAGHTLAACASRSGVIRFIDRASGLEICSLAPQEDALTSLAFTTDSKLVCGFDDGSIRILPCLPWSSLPKAASPAATGLEALLDALRRHLLHIK